MSSSSAGGKLQGITHNFRYILSKEQVSPCKRAKKKVWMHFTITDYLILSSAPGYWNHCPKQRLFSELSIHSLAGGRTNCRCNSKCCLWSGSISSNDDHFRPPGLLCCMLSVHCSFPSWCRLPFLRQNQMCWLPLAPPSWDCSQSLSSFVCFLRCQSTEKQLTDVA